MIKIKHNCRYGDFVYNDCDFYVSKSLDAYGEFSELELAILRQVIRPGMTVVDAGANLGGFTVPFAKFVQHGKVIAIEPQKWVYYQLCANVVINNLNNVDCLNVAVGKESGEVRFPYLNYNVTGNYGGIKAGTTGYPIPLITIDSLNLDACHFLKIDVEGMDFDVLQGAKETIAKHRPFINFESIEKDDPAVAWLEELGYDCHRYAARGFNANNHFNNPTNVFEPPGVASFNVFCLPQERNIQVNK